MLENSEKYQKIPKKILKKYPQVQKVPKIANKSQKYSNKLFFWLEKSGKIPKKLPKIPENIYILYKN